ncbi:1,2-dihydroxy-3-keto-5-methylthiopentene dioxygenase [Eumeta japonica]|uniref:Acireductone dioxygenase n=1 Tax=Eumeta variegata TaxID=151549 RepID=A0A4C1WEJ2_EUMVA|nr:1,2-dihydroxy-3-keto-5-methylthiopentene dioxygenase [Eumeta japonica]
MRILKGKWTKDVIEWNPRNGKRQKGRQIKRCENDLPKGWKRSARDRMKSKKLGGPMLKDNLTNKMVADQYYSDLKKNYQTIIAWYMDSEETDQRLEHHLNPPQYIDLDELYRKTGVEYFKLNIDTYKNDGVLDGIKSERGYTYEDEISCSKECMSNYEEKLKAFYQEHLHTDEEIRFVLDGSGYFDVRDAEDKWIRIAVQAGDMIILPSGIYHRFTLDFDAATSALTCLPAFGSLIRRPRHLQFSSCNVTFSSCGPAAPPDAASVIAPRGARNAYNLPDWLTLMIVVPAFVA